MAVETWTDRGEDFYRYTYDVTETWAVGIDIGQRVDHTAICVMRGTRAPQKTFTFKRGANGRNVYNQDCKMFYDVVALERLALGLDYPLQEQLIVELLKRPPLNRIAHDVVIDVSGPGLAIAQSLEAHRQLRLLKLCITAGAEESRARGASSQFNVPKGVLITSLDAALNYSELRFAKELAEGSTLKEELADFRRHVGSAGRATYAARTGAHDDLVLCVSYALWRCRGGGPVKAWHGAFAAY